MGSAVSSSIPLAVSSAPTNGSCAMRWNEHYGPIPAATDRWTRSPCSSLLLWSAAKTFPGDGASYQSRQTKRFADVISVINSAAPAPPVISKYNPIRTTPLTLRWNARGYQFHENHARLDIFQSRWWETGGMRSGKNRPRRCVVQPKLVVCTVCTGVLQEDAVRNCGW